VKVLDSGIANLRGKKLTLVNFVFGGMPKTDTFEFFKESVEM
jgi:hypothetical protein